jgi:hypothetical protein
MGRSIGDDHALVMELVDRHVDLTRPEANGEHARSAGANDRDRHETPLIASPQ